MFFYKRNNTLEVFPFPNKLFDMNNSHTMTQTAQGFFSSLQSFIISKRKCSLLHFLNGLLLVFSFLLAVLPGLGFALQDLLAILVELQPCDHDLVKMRIFFKEQPACSAHKTYAFLFLRKPETQEHKIKTSTCL